MQETKEVNPLPHKGMGGGGGWGKADPAPGTVVLSSEHVPSVDSAFRI